MTIDLAMAFERNSKTAYFDLNSPGSIVTSPVLAGARAYQPGSGNSGSGDQASLPAVRTEVWGRFRFHISAAESTTRDIFGFRDGGSSQSYLIYDAERLAVYRGDQFGTQLYITPIVITPLTIHVIDYHYKCANSGGRWEVWVDGTQVIDVTADTVSTANENFDRIEWLQTTNAVITIDDFIQSDGSAPHSTRFPQTLVGAGLVPTAVASGALTGVGDTGANRYLNVANITPDSADYNYTTGTDQDLYDLTDPSNTATIVCIAEYLRAFTDTGTAQVKQRLKTNGLEFDSGSARSIDTTATWFRNFRHLNPATGVAFTASEIDALQAGMVGV